MANILYNQKQELFLFLELSNFGKGTMTGIKHSRQRDAIRDNLRSRCDHPTAEMIFQDIRVRYPKISRGTVYRNLALLSELGEIRHLPVEDGADRYDGKMEPHSHFICRICGDIRDLPPVDSALLKASVSSQFDGIIEGSKVRFTGLCAKCAAEQEKHPQNP